MSTSADWGGETGNAKTGEIVTFATNGSEEERPGTFRAMQCWLQRIEFVCAQQKQVLKAQQEELARASQAVTSMERREDSQQAQPTDWLRQAQPRERRRSFWRAKLCTSTRRQARAACHRSSSGCGP